MTTTSRDRLSATALAEMMRLKIDSGQWPPRHLLPSEIEGAAQYGVARGTYRQALRLLREMGRVETRRGTGTWVRERPLVRLLDEHRYAPRSDLDLALVRMLSGDGGEEEAYGFAHTSEPERLTAAELAPEVRRMLRLAGDASVVRVRGVLVADGAPAHTGQVCMPVEMAQMAGQTGAMPQLLAGAIRRRLEEKGCVHVETRELVSTRLPKESEAAELGMPREMPVLVLEWRMDVTCEQWSGPAAVGQVVLPGDRVIVGTVFR